jgi:hypothetical protein
MRETRRRTLRLSKVCQADLIVATLTYVVFSCVTSAASAQEPPGGSITYSVRQAMGLRSTMVYSVRGRLIRIDTQRDSLPQSATSMLIDRDRGVGYFVLPGQTFMKFPLGPRGSGDSAVSTKDTAGSHRGLALAPGLNPTGQQEVVAGTPCEDYVSTLGSTTFNVCMANGLGNLLGSHSLPTPLGFAGIGGTQPDMGQLIRGNFGLLKQVITSVDGSDTLMVMIATRIRRTAPDSTVFAIPSHYREIPFGLPTGLSPRPPASPR